MKKMSQSEFDKLCFCANSKDCNHPDVVRLVDAYTGAHMDYGCETRCLTPLRKCYKWIEMKSC